MSLEAALAEATKRGEKPRSGYARKKIAMMRLYAEKERLQADHEALQKAYQDLAGYSDTLNAEIKRVTKSAASKACTPRCSRTFNWCWLKTKGCSMPSPSCAAAPSLHSPPIRRSPHTRRSVR